MRRQFHGRFLVRNHARRQKPCGKSRRAHKNDTQAHRPPLTRRRCVALGFADFFQNHLPLQPRQMVKKHNAVQMIHFVLDARRQQAVAMDFLRLPMVIEKFDTAFGRPLDIIVKARHGQTTLLVIIHRIRDPSNFRIDEKNAGLRLPAPIGHSDLRDFLHRCPYRLRCRLRHLKTVIYPSR